MPFDPLRTPFDLSDQQVDWSVDIVGLNVADNGIEEGANLLVVRGSQRPLLLPWERTHTQPCFE